MRQPKVLNTCAVSCQICWPWLLASSLENGPVMNQWSLKTYLTKVHHLPLKWTKTFAKDLDSWVQLEDMYLPLKWNRREKGPLSEMYEVLYQAYLIHLSSFSDASTWQTFSMKVNNIERPTTSRTHMTKNRASASIDPNHLSSLGRPIRVATWVRRFLLYYFLKI